MQAKKRWKKKVLFTFKRQFQSTKIFFRAVAFDADTSAMPLGPFKMQTIFPKACGLK